MKRAAWPAPSTVLRIACGVAILFFASQILTYGHGRDQSIYAVVARTWLEGGMPYRDAWDFKPPGIFAFYAAARVFFGDAEWSIRVLEALSLLVTSAAAIVWSKREFGCATSGWLAAAINALIQAQLDFWHTAQPESFAGMLTLLALCAAPKLSFGETPYARARWVVAGALFGCAGLCKPPLGLAGLALVLGVAAPWKKRLSIAGLGALGTALPVLLCGVYFFARGALGDAIDVLGVYTPHYTKLSWEGSSVLGMFYYGTTQWLTRYSALIPVGLGVLLAWVPPTNARPALAALGVIVIHLVGVTMQAKFFPYHFAATWPVTALLVARGLYLLYARWTARYWTLGLAWAAVIATLCAARSATMDTEDSFATRAWIRLEGLLSGGLSDAQRDALASVADVNAAANRRVARFVSEQTPKEAPIYVWGFEPSIYHLSGRPLASRFVYNVPQRTVWSREVMRTRLMADLRARPPAAIVVSHNDVFPMVTGDTLDSASALEEFTELRELLARQYRHATREEDFDVYLPSLQQPSAPNP